MKLSPIQTSGAALILAAATVWFWQNHQELASIEVITSPQNRPATHLSQNPERDSSAGRGQRIDSSREPKPWRVNPTVLEHYSPEMEQQFYQISDLGMFYESRGFRDFGKLMREALLGDPDALAQIFTSPEADGAASESFDHVIREFLEQVGDRYFAHHLGKQPHEVRLRIVTALWRHQIDEILDGLIPSIGDQTCPSTSRLARNQEAGTQ